MAIDYIYKTTPRNHQREILERTAELPFHALHLEQGTGKTKIAIDNIAYLYQQKKIDGALIVAPNGINLNWFIDEIPIHLPETTKNESRICLYLTKRAKQKRQQEEVKWTKQHPGLAWMIMTYDAFMTEEGKVTALTFLEQRKAFYVLDESTRIKSPGAKRTQRIVRTAHRALYKRTLTGTPMPNGAFDIYSQIKFLDDEFWARRGWDSFAMFKAYFGVFTQHAKTVSGKIQEWEQLVGFQHLEELNKLIAPISTRVLKRDVLDLPPKIYQTRYFELTPAQREIYNSLREEFMVWLDAQTLVTANLAMVRMLRLQQVSCGYLPTGLEEPIHMIGSSNPRLELLEEVIEDFNDKMIIWSRYTKDVELITDMLRSRKNCKFVTYIGSTSDTDMIRAKEEFQRGDAQFFISNPAKGAEGITLHAAKAVTYYTNSFNLNHRLQSEDRAHRDGLKHSVNYIDLLGVDTIDAHVLKNLCGKMDTSDIVLGDLRGVDIRSQLGEWLNGKTSR